VRTAQTNLRQMYLAHESPSYFPQGKRMAMLKEPVQAALAAPGQDGSCVLKIFGRDIAFSSAEWDKYVRVIRTYTASHIEHLGKRFPDDPFMEAFDCLDLADVPSMREGESENDFAQRLALHGVNDLMVLLEHYSQPFRTEAGKVFSPLVDRDAALGQYAELKALVIQIRAEEEKKPLALREELTSDKLWEHFFKHKRDYNLQAMLDLRVLELTQALTTSCAERGISTLGQIKTKLRNRLHVPTADNLMEIFLNGPDLDDKTLCAELYAEAFRLFMTMVNRNPRKAHFKPRPKQSGQATRLATSRPVCEPLNPASDEEERELEAELYAGERDSADDDEPDEPEVDPETEARRLQALYDAVGDFPGLDGWHVMEDMPTLSTTELKKPNIKIAHKFNTGAYECIVPLILPHNTPVAYEYD